MVKSPNRGSTKGFTLIELLIIIGIIGFLASAILVAVDPVRRIGEARNAKRWSEVNGILNAILTKQVDDRASYTGSTNYPIIASDTLGQLIIDIPADTAGNPTCVGQVPATVCPAKTFDVAALHVAQCYVNLGVSGASALVPTYLAQVPLDPNGGATTNSKYYLQKYLSGRIEVGACAPDTISGSPVTIKVIR